MLVGSRGRRIRAPDEDRAGVSSRAGIEPLERGPVQVVERDVAGLVAHRVRVDLGRPEPVEEPEREVVADHRESAGVMGVQHRAPAVLVHDRPQPVSDLRDRVLPGDRREAALPLRSDPSQRGRQACVRVEHHAVVGARALLAQLAPADGVVRVAAHDGPAIRAPHDQHATRVVAVPRAGGPHANRRAGRRAGGSVGRRAGRGITSRTRSRSAHREPPPAPRLVSERPAPDGRTGGEPCERRSPARAR